MATARVFENRAGVIGNGTKWSEGLHGGCALVCGVDFCAKGVSKRDTELCLFGSKGWLC